MPKSLIERAYELASSGHCVSLREVRCVLKAERYTNIDWALHGAGLRRQLKSLIQQSRAERLSNPSAGDPVARRMP